MHGGFVLGLALIAMFALGEFLNDKKSKEYLYYLYAFLISLFSTLINPYGIEYISFIVDAFKLNRIHIIEWQSAFFNKLLKYNLIKFKLFFFPTIGIFLYSILKNIKKDSFEKFYKNIDKTKYIILFFVSIIALKALRCHVFFTLSVLVFCYKDFYSIFNKKLPLFVDKVKEVVLLILLGISAVAHIYDYQFVNLVKDSQYPIYAIEFIKINNLKGNVFVNFHNGSHAAYKLYPNNYLFMDGRYEEVYDNDLINKMGRAFRAINHQEFLKEFHHDILIVEKYYPLSEELKSDENWFLAFEDDNYVLYLSKKYKKQKFKYPTKDKNYYNKTKFNTSINWLN